VLHQGVEMITIWKLENDLWILVEEIESMEELLTTIEDLRIDGNEYRAELKTESTSQILEV
jgi:hypothetical protein